MKKTISTPHAPEAIGAYSQAIETPRYLYLSGQLGIDPHSGLLQEGVEAQANRAMENVQAILKEAGCSFSQVVKSTIYLTRAEDFPIVNEIYASYFNAPYPARTTVIVAALPRGGSVEIEVIALTPTAP